MLLPKSFSGRSRPLSLLGSDAIADEGPLLRRAVSFC